MGNCQAIDAASLVIQHTNGREERLYWPVMAKEIMRLNPGYYVALIITYHVSEEQQRRSSNPYSNSNPNTNNGVRITRVKLLRPSDSLTLGQAYKLIDSQEVMKGLWAKKFAKMKKQKDSESSDDQSGTRVREIQSSGFHQIEETSSELGEPNQASTRPERHRSSSFGRSRHWRPSLQSISEATN
ncbi:hypothetical protein C5167_042339 [Papaver somniferum]|uniref:DUF4228 domain-containing protein n=1 Tax=Papaver somniferum TaxID=3469 RepID=A0A4Y7L491_PAPSO|nr:uncharacterized protein LOC113317471 [Papaver somniferum]RZC79767.1 hypothetical protein C5167_042339 [Papaver somniferum]